jgi:V8-like Glu-specific endopeptidase
MKETNNHPAQMDAPLTPDQLLSYDNVPASLKMPTELKKHLTISRLIVSADKDLRFDKPHEQTLNGDHVYDWSLPSGAFVGQLVRKTTDLVGTSLSKQKKPHSEHNKPHRPAWADHVYHPKRTISSRGIVMPKRTISSRLGGQVLHRPKPHRGGEVFYGVYGVDDRSVYYPFGYPWQCVGRFFVYINQTQYPNWSGSGVLIGPRVVLTAGHMVPWDAKVWGMLFVPGYYDGQSVVGSGAGSWATDAQGWSVSYFSRYPDAHDMAVVRLQDSLGDSLGYFGSKGYFQDWQYMRYFNLTGYPDAVAGGERPSYEPGIEVMDSDASADAVALEFQDDSTPGDSGAPFWATWSDGFPYVIGTISGGEANPQEDNNIAAGGKAMDDLISWARSNWP